MATDTMTPSTIAADKARLLAEADAAHEQYPQYRGHFDGYVVAEAVRDLVHPKWGDLLLAKGERCLIDPARIRREEGCDEVMVTAYFARNLSGCDTSWPVADFAAIG